jgi:hypothetical protein
MKNLELIPRKPCQTISSAVLGRKKKHTKPQKIHAINIPVLYG